MLLQVLDVVRGNYDTLTLKLQDSLDQYERYSEKPKETSFFTQLVNIEDSKERQHMWHCKPTNTGHCPCVGSMLGQRRRWWASIDPTHGQYPVFAGNAMQGQTTLTAYFSYKQLFCIWICICSFLKQIDLDPFKSEFKFVVFINYKPRIAVAILDL